MVNQHWWADLRLLVEGGKVAGEDRQTVVTRLQTLVTKAAEYVLIISALTVPIEAQRDPGSVVISGRCFGFAHARIEATS